MIDNDKENKNKPQKTSFCPFYLIYAIAKTSDSIKTIERYKKACKKNRRRVNSPKASVLCFCTMFFLLRFYLGKNISLCVGFRCTAGIRTVKFNLVCVSVCLCSFCFLRFLLLLLMFCFFSARIFVP